MTFNKVDSLSVASNTVILIITIACYRENRQKEKFLALLQHHIPDNLSQLNCV